MTDEKCPRCKEGIIQRTALTPPNKGEAIGCNRCPYPLGEPGLSYDPLEVDEGWEPPYRNKNACLEQVKQAVAPMWHNIDALRKQLDFLENIIEDALTTYYGDDCYYQLKQDYNAYQQEFYGVKEDRPHKDPGKARAAKTARTK